MPRIVFVFVDVGGVICVMSVCSVLCTLGPGWGPALSPHLRGFSRRIYLKTFNFSVINRCFIKIIKLF